MIVAIAAMNQRRVIGNKGDIPWSLPEDQRYFARVTRGHTVLMGRKTYQSFPAAYRPLPDRQNVVATRSPEDFLRGQEIPQSVSVITDIDAFIADFRRQQQPDVILWVIGGEELYRKTRQDWDEVYLTQVFGDQPGDTHFPEFEHNFEEFWREEHATHVYKRYRRVLGKPGDYSGQKQ